MSSLFSNASWFLIINVLQKLITFVCNQLMISRTNPEILGKAAIQLELLLSTFLFLSREGIRLAVLRITVHSARDLQSIVNVSWIPSCMIVLFTIMIRIFYDRTIDNNIRIVYMYSFAAFVECLAEPAFNVFQNALYIQPRLTAETSAVFMRSIATFLFVVYFRMEVEGFGYAQICYGTTYFLVLVLHTRFYHSHGGTKFTCAQAQCGMEWQLFPRLLPKQQGQHESENRLKPSWWTTYTERLFCTNVLESAVTLTGSSILKHVLTEADKIALTLTATAYNQGIYAVTNNYGSLVARVLFLPLEDSARLSFSQLVSNFKRDVQEALLAVTLKQTATKLTRNDEHQWEQHDSRIVEEPKRRSGRIRTPPTACWHGNSSSSSTNTSSSSSDDTRGIQPRITRSKSKSQNNHHYGVPTPAATMITRGPSITTSTILTTTTTTDATDAPVTSAIDRCQHSFTALRDSFLRLMRLVTLVGVIFTVFGIPYTKVVVLYVLKGTAWDVARVQQTANALACYCIYLLVLGINGISESFVQACHPVTPHVFRRLNGGLLCSSIAFVALAIPGVHYGGTSGLILANAFGMTVRIVSNCAYIVHIFGDSTRFFQVISISPQQIAAGSSNISYGMGDSSSNSSDRNGKFTSTNSSTIDSSSSSSSTSDKGVVIGVRGSPASVVASDDLNVLVVDNDDDAHCQLLPLLPRMDLNSWIGYVAPPLSWMSTTIISGILLHSCQSVYDTYTAEVIASSSSSSSSSFPTNADASRRLLLVAAAIYLAIGVAVGLVFLTVTLFTAPASDTAFILRRLGRSQQKDKMS